MARLRDASQMENVLNAHPIILFAEELGSLVQALSVLGQTRAGARHGRCADVG
jgi:hypothetical protein